MPIFPWWWSWELRFTKHMKMRMPERRVTEPTCALCWSVQRVSSRVKPRVGIWFTRDMRVSRGSLSLSLKPISDVWRSLPPMTYASK